MLMFLEGASMSVRATYAALCSMLRSAEEVGMSTVPYSHVCTAP